MSAATGSFAGFTPAAFAFFRGLAAHNDPAWFKPRKAVYDSAVLAPFRALIVAVGAALEAAGVPLVGDPARGMFRLYRDVRFSADKRLYKSHAGAVLTRSGGKRDPGLLYLHVEPGASEAGLGFWQPDPPLLQRLRRAMLDDPDGFAAMAERLKGLGSPLTTDAEFARLPRGCEAASGTAIADYIRWKSFIAERALSDAEMQSPALVDRIVAFAVAARPLLDWGWAAIEDDMPPLALRLPVRPLPRPDF